MISIRKVLGTCLVTSGIILVAYATFTNIHSTVKMNSVLDSNIREEQVISDEDSLITSDMKILKVKEMYNVLSIPSIDVLVPVTEGISKENLEYSVGHFSDTPNLGESGNICVAGHRSSVYNCVFNDVDKLSMGDSLLAYDGNGKEHAYSLVETKVIAPNDWGMLSDFGDNRLTIITCTENGTMRLCLVFKELSELDRVKMLKDSNSDVYIQSKEALNEYVLSAKALQGKFKRVSDTKVVKYKYTSSNNSVGTGVFIPRGNLLADKCKLSNSDISRFSLSDI